MGDFLDPDPHEVQKSAEHFKEKDFYFFLFKIYFINTNPVKPLKKLNISMSNLYEFFVLTSNFLHPGSGFGSALQPMRNHITAVNFWKTSLQGLGAHAHKLTHTHTPRTHHHTHKQDRTKGGYQFPICPPIRSHLSD